MKKTLGLLLVTLMCLLSFSTVFAAEYTDVNGHWAESSIERWTEEKVVNGYDDNTFKPENNVTRAEFVAMIVRMLQPTATADLAAYNDVDADAWYYDVMAKAVAMELIEGYSNNTLKPTANITRQEAMVILNRVLSLTASKDASSEKFSDAKDIADWAEEAILAFIENGYVNGYENGTIQPKALITRAESAKLLNKAIGLIIREAGEYDLSKVEGAVIVLAEKVELKNAENVDAIVEADKKAEDDKEEDKEEEKETTSGGSGGGSSASNNAKITLKENGDVYKVTVTGTVKDGKKLKVVVGTKTVLDIDALSSDMLTGEEMDTLLAELDIQKIINTLSSDKYNEVDALRDWGMATVLAIENEDAQYAAFEAAVMTDGEKALVSVVFDALVDEYMTAEELADIALSVLDYNAAIGAINNI
ncbi:MAG: S-layer homology domain-containing protein [Clostridia bacterium]|nr:S-layer homology domain-containing protein [Clostridia bacterium]